MRKSIILALYSVFLVGFSLPPVMSGARASESTLAVTGIVVASGCQVDTGSVDQNVKIGTFTAKDFPSVGSTSSFKAMNINLSKCYSGLTTVQVTFSGVTDADNPGLLAITDTGVGGTLATGVGVELLDNGGKNIPLDTKGTQTFELDEGNNTLSFLLRYKSTRYPVTSGEASAVMYFDLAYP
ncbi:fimbrial protein [Enterobacter quasiroggenkampii]|uniref:fimbrial protein n=1 Tax=Enterobacter quasiroggenkampii TaxID=2497436 RepID=UPI0021D165E1|nr:fimbrial protein [Enterobacter quasiroggenkampii]MCU6278861.1 fimbrial protein [Enterobacter quasiroggenkampii]